MTAHNTNGAGAPGIDTPEDRELLARMAAELLVLEARAEPMLVSVSPVSAVQLAGLLQLALRHPRASSGESAAAGRRFLVGVREYFADAPAVLAILARGDDPSHDR